jgi:hypothetical protein
MQKLITLGCLLDVVVDVAAVMSDSSGAALPTHIAIGLVPAALGFAQLCRRAVAESDDIAEFRAETIRR